MVIGITGGVGCGKSSVMKLMNEKYGFLPLEADKIGHMLMEKGQEVYREIVEHFGTGILDGNQNIDRKLLGNIVFNDNSELEFLNSLIHPGVRKYINDIVTNAKPNENFLIEAALLLEAGYRDVCDSIWYIYADENVRRERLKKSRGYTDEKINEIMGNQLSDEEFREKTDIFIDNSSTIDETGRQIEKIVEF